MQFHEKEKNCCFYRPLEKGCILSLKLNVWECLLNSQWSRLLRCPFISHLQAETWCGHRTQFWGSRNHIHTTARRSPLHSHLLHSLCSRIFTYMHVTWSPDNLLSINKNSMTSHFKSNIFAVTMKIFLSWIQAGKESSNAFKPNTDRDQELGSMSLQFSTWVHA